MTEPTYRFLGERLEAVLRVSQRVYRVRPRRRVENIVDDNSEQVFVFSSEQPPQPLQHSPR